MTTERVGEARLWRMPETMMVAPQLLLVTLLLVIIPPCFALDLPSHGCYWTEACQSKWFGGCTDGIVVADESENCNGLCGESSIPPCLPFHTHFHCCKPELPRVSNRCARCKNKLDFGEDYVCCTDCSDPYIIDKKSKLGYCKTGAELAMQLKPQEVFKWITGPWMKCSSPCDGGIRYRDVGCYGTIDDTSIKHYPVDDSRCSEQEMPTRQEPCNLHSCGEFSFSDSGSSQSRGMHGWLVGLLVLIGAVAIGGIGFVGYIYYKRRNSTPSGFVYIMMEGYS